jgi:hypothetical protein
MSKHMILAALAMLLTFATGACTNPTADAARAELHSGPYDNTANSLGGRYVGGGD